MENKYISTLVITKIILAASTLYFFAIYLGWDMFSYPDFHESYGKCAGDAWLPYGNIFCSLSSLTGQEVTYKTPIFIFIAALINLLILIGYFSIAQRYLTKYGKYLLILMLVAHPYLNVYFFRFYTDIFATIGIFMIFYYKINNKNIDILFIIFSLILMNFRVALIPVFFILAAWEIYSNFKNANNKLIYPFLLFMMTAISYIPVMSFSYKFASINSEINFFIKVIFNLVYTFGFKESVAVSRVFMSEYQIIDFISLLASFILIIIHSIGLYGFIKFTSIKKNMSLLVVFSYLLVPILAISHMRYLLPLMPILLFGFAYLFFGKKPKKI